MKLETIRLPISRSFFFFLFFLSQVFFFSKGNKGEIKITWDNKLSTLRLILLCSHRNSDVFILPKLRERRMEAPLYPQRFMGKTVNVPHFNRDTVEYAPREDWDDRIKTRDQNTASFSEKHYGLESHLENLIFKMS